MISEARPTIYMSDRKLQVWLPDTDLAAPGVALFSVFNPGGGASNPVSFSIQ